MKSPEVYAESAELALSAAARIYNDDAARPEGVRMMSAQLEKITFHHERAAVFAALAVAAATVRSSR